MRLGVLHQPFRQRRDDVRFSDRSERNHEVGNGQDDTPRETFLRQRYIVPEAGAMCSANGSLWWTSHFTLGLNSWVLWSSLANSGCQTAAPASANGGKR